MVNKLYLKQIAEDRTSAEALKHTVVGGETVAGDAATSWIYPGNARSVIFVSTGEAKAQLRGGGGSGLEASNYRLYTPTAGSNKSSTTVCGSIFGNALPHEFRILDTSSSENKITWYINY